LRGSGDEEDELDDEGAGSGDVVVDDDGFGKGGGDDDDGRGASSECVSAKDAAVEGALDAPFDSGALAFADEDALEPPPRAA